MQCKCEYYLMNDEGVRACSVCGKPSPNQPVIEDKMVGRQQTKKAPLYVSDKDRAKA